MNIRKIESNDLTILSELFVSVFNSEPWSESWTKEWAYQRLSIIFKSYRFHGFVAEKEGVPVGAIFSRIGSYKGELEVEVIEKFCKLRGAAKGCGSGLDG